MKIEPRDLKRVLVTDCGSTTTKALLFEETSEGWRQTHRGEAPTTVEEPVADVTIGAINAFSEIEEISGIKLLKPTGSTDEDSPFILRDKANRQGDGIDLYLSTSSAGGGLQMMVAGVVRDITTESAERAALGAGAIVLDAISQDDGREEHERIKKIRHLRPDIVLLTGGVDGGSRTHAVEMAELLLAASPRPRFGDTLKLPIIYAGNRDVQEEVKEILEKVAQVSIVRNVRPALDVEDLGPAREAIHEFFLTHVMSHSPGYGKLLKWTPVAVMPTPAAVGDMVLGYAKKHSEQVLCVDIGGATTDVFSVFRNKQAEDVFNRTVSANFGMSYSVANVLVETGAQNIMRWLPYKISEYELRDRLRNKMIRPTSIPQTKEDLWLEQAVCREALRLSLQHHRSLAVGLSGVSHESGIADIFSQQGSRYELVDLMKLDLVIGSGGVLSHAPHRLEAALMMLDGFALQGLTKIAVDSIFMMPHLGVFSSVHPSAAEEIFRKDCLVHVGHAIAPVFSPKLPSDCEIANILIEGKSAGILRRGKVSRLELQQGSQVHIKIEPIHQSVDVGTGVGKPLERAIEIGLHGIILDGRNRPIELPLNESARIDFQRNTLVELKIW